ncbi:Uncharacterised protein [Chlamydia abortus]|nr:Uncharacterised protein [Chlamydia abortus]
MGARCFKEANVPLAFPDTICPKASEIANKTRSKDPSKAPPIKIDPNAADVIKMSIFTVLLRISSNDFIKAGVPARKNVKTTNRLEISVT